MLTPTSGLKPCGSVTPTVAVGDSCTLYVAFQPASGGTFNATLDIRSDDPQTPLFGLPIVGTREGVTALTVRINQLDTFACSNPRTTAYVSVTDQGGFTVPGLQMSNFTVTQGASNALLTLIAPFSFIGALYKNIAISTVLDHSGSLTEQAQAFADMQTGFANLLNGMKAGDKAEVIKFATQYEITQPFTENKTALAGAIAAPFPASYGIQTLLYDTVYKALDETALQPQAQFRRAVVVATDGVDEGPSTGIPLSVNTVDTVIASAKSKNIPIFAIGIGSKVASADLEKMASQTGGLYYQASASQNLATIYQQLATLLYENQYLLTFDRAVTGVQSPITITATSGTLSGFAPRDIIVCP